MIVTNGKELLRMILVHELDVMFRNEIVDAFSYLAEGNTDDDIERMFESSEEVLEDPK